MPALAATHEFLHDKPLKIVFDIQRLENPEDWEGWLVYDAKLYCGDECVTSIDGATIIDSDVDSFLSILSSEERGEFEPLEPDFHVAIQPAIGAGLALAGENKTELLVFIDEARRRGQGYSGQGVGLRMLVEKKELKKFVTDLREQYSDLTSGAKRAD